MRWAGSMTIEPKSSSFSFSEFLAMTFARSTRRSSCLAAGDKLAHGERLGHIIIGTRSQTDDLVGLVITCGEDQHRHRTFGDDAFGGL